MSEFNDLGAVILAGGQSRRMAAHTEIAQRHGAKFLLDLSGSTQGKPMLAHVTERIRPQLTGPMALNANIPTENLPEQIGAAFEGRIIPDDPPNFSGPLAGVLAGLRWAASLAESPRAIVTVAADTPFFPPNLVARFLEVEALSGQPLVCAASNGRHHPVFGLWPLTLLEDLETAVLKEGLRKVDLWTQRHGLGVAEWAYDKEGLDPFFNFNRPEDFTKVDFTKVDFTKVDFTKADFTQN